MFCLSLNKNATTWYQQGGFHIASRELELLSKVHPLLQVKCWGLPGLGGCLLLKIAFYTLVFLVLAWSMVLQIDLAITFSTWLCGYQYYPSPSALVQMLWMCYKVPPGWYRGHAGVTTWLEEPGHQGDSSHLVWLQYISWWHSASRSLLHGFHSIWLWLYICFFIYISC